MPIIDTYETSYGKVINKSRYIKEVQEYITRSDTPLDYEYIQDGDVRLVIITGYSREEKDITLFEHPLVFKDLRDKDVVAVDVRKYVKNDRDEEQPSTIAEITKDKAGLEYTLLRGLLTIDFLKHEYGNLRQLYPSISSGYAIVLAKLLNIYVKLNPEELVAVEIACALFNSSLFVDFKDLNEVLPNLVARLCTFKYSIPMTRVAITRIAEPIVINGQTLEDLIDVIKQVLPEEKANLVNDSVIVNLMSNMWYGPGGNESLLIALEHLPTWIAVEYVSLAHNSYKKARLSQMLNSASKQVDSKGFVKEIELYLKEKEK